jgi:integrase/recombinase XerD
VAACYSKHRREDTQVLHPELARQLREWLATKAHLGLDEPLFPISGRVPGGTERKAFKMIERDLMAARDKWLEDAKTPKEHAERLKSDFLCYCNHDGLFADFHSMRHLFITSLERAGVSPKMAQTLARHSDIRLTLGVYTHVELPDCTAAIDSLPAPPRA